MGQAQGPFGSPWMQRYRCKGFLSAGIGAVAEEAQSLDPSVIKTLSFPLKNSLSAHVLPCEALRVHIPLSKASHRHLSTLPRRKLFLTVMVSEQGGVRRRRSAHILLYFSCVTPSFTFREYAKEANTPIPASFFSSVRQTQSHASHSILGKDGFHVAQ